MVSSETKIAWAMLLKYTSEGMIETLAPASMAITVQSGVDAMATDFLLTKSCHTPAGPAAWMSKSFLVKPDLESIPRSA